MWERRPPTGEECALYYTMYRRTCDLSRELLAFRIYNMLRSLSINKPKSSLSSIFINPWTSTRTQCIVLARFPEPKAPTCNNITLYTSIKLVVREPQRLPELAFTATNTSFGCSEAHSPWGRLRGTRQGATAIYDTVDDYITHALSQHVAKLLYKQLVVLGSSSQAPAFNVHTLLSIFRSIHSLVSLTATRASFCRYTRVSSHTSTFSMGGGGGGGAQRSDTIQGTG